MTTEVYSFDFGGGGDVCGKCLVIVTQAYIYNINISAGVGIGCLFGKERKKIDRYLVFNAQ